MSEKFYSALRAKAHQMGIVLASIKWPRILTEQEVRDEMEKDWQEMGLAHLFGDAYHSVWVASAFATYQWQVEQMRAFFEKPEV